MRNRSMAPFQYSFLLVPDPIRLPIKSTFVFVAGTPLALPPIVNVPSK